MDSQKRQKKLERRKAKQKAERRESARRDSRGLSARLEQASASPILHSCTTAEIWQKGIGHVLISRELNGGNVAFAVFLVDIYCLGVKDVFTNITPRAQYDVELYGKLARRGALIQLKPEGARKLVEGAVQYALDLGLPPHADYRTGKLIFGNISSEACAEEYTFGKDGKPFFIAGPHDNPARCKQILSTLHSHCGPEGYHFIIPSGGPLPM